MSSYEKLEYTFEAAGFDYGPEILIATLLVVSIVLGASLSYCILSGKEESETKQARKVLASVLNNETEAKPTTQPSTGDEMFEVPLNDACSYQGPGVDQDALTSNTAYAKVAAAPTRAKNMQTTRVGNLTEDEEYSFDCEL